MEFPRQSREEAIRAILADDNTATVVVHRAVAGEHDGHTGCWCEPIVLQARLTPGQLLDELERIERLH